MSELAIDIEGLGKSYMLGVRSNAGAYGSLREHVSDAVRSVFRRLGDRSVQRRHSDSDNHEFWALRDLTLQVRDGDRIGVIGRNGAGKSTLLKILSRITEPSAGRATIWGRVTSLLEVGTGFHPELTGRENIFLSGAILGMSRIDISKKFDQIVSFAEVEKFLDTPVKRYSSGMYVRLAFSVAAHLESEILIVDEVLAVGDAEFQRKCLARMGDVTREGRTTLFVSHNMAAVTQLCNRGVVLTNGALSFDGDVKSAVQHYMDTGLQGDAISEFPMDNSKKVQIVRIGVADSTGAFRSSHDWNEGITVEVEIISRVSTAIACVVQLVTGDGVRVCQLNSANFFQKLTQVTAGQKIRYRAVIPGGLLNPGVFSVSTIVTEGNVGAYDYRSSSSFWIEAMTPSKDYLGKRKKDLSLIRVQSDWSVS